MLTIYFHNNMNQSITCAFCLEYGHTIQFCRDYRIIESFKHLIRLSISPDFESAIVMALNDYSDILVSAIGVQMCRTIPEESREHHTNKIIDAVKIEIDYLSQLDGIQYDEYMEWLYPEELNSENDLVSDNDLVMNLDDDVLNLATIFDRLPDEETTYLPTALLMCIETQEELKAPAECSICLETKTVFDMNKFQCQHDFCHCCVLQMLFIYSNMSCPLCREKIKTIEVKDTEMYNDIQCPPLHIYLA